MYQTVFFCCFFFNIYLIVTYEPDHCPERYGQRLQIFIYIKIKKKKHSYLDHRETQTNGKHYNCKQNIAKTARLDWNDRIFKGLEYNYKMSI